jgi:hypothetical protein
MSCEILGVRRLRRSGKAIAVLASILAGSSMQGCCDLAVATETSSAGESSTTSDGGSSESTGEPALPEWAIGIFSSESDNVGMTWDGQEKQFWYPWGNVEINAEGMLFVDFYVCTEWRERQEFRWTSTDGGQSLTLESVPPADVFTFGTDEDVSDVVVEPGDSCDTIIIRTFHVEAMSWAVSEYHRGNVCAKSVGDPADCILTLEWCDGMPPVPCE